MLPIKSYSVYRFVGWLFSWFIDWLIDWLIEYCYSSLINAYSGFHQYYSRTLLQKACLLEWGLSLWPRVIISFSALPLSQVRLPPWLTFTADSNSKHLQANNFTLHSIYTHFNILKKKAFGKHCGKWWNCSKWAISPFSTIFSMQSVSQNSLIATFQLSPAASLNLGQSQNGVLGNGLNVYCATLKTQQSKF